MKILGCFKVVPDLELMSEQDWNTVNNTEIDTTFIKSILNCFDESMLEIMLKLSDLSESFNTIIEKHALTIGGDVCGNYLKTLYALKYSKAVRISTNEDLSFSPEKVAQTIVSYVKKTGNYDVLMFGSYNAVGENSKTPILVAEKLGMKFITQVLSVKPCDENNLIIVNEVDGGIVEQKVELPCVISVGNAPSTYLRVPTLKDRMSLGKQEIEVYTPEDLGLNYSKIEETEVLVSLKSIDNGRSAVLIEGDSPKEKAENLYNLVLKEKLDI